MSRFTQYNKNDTYRDNYNYANIQKERRTNEELEEIERDRKAMERLQIELDQEKKLEKERKNQIRQQQYEDYSNYMRQKYSETPKNREKLNIKLGGEQRSIRKPNYNQQMENLCLNPTKQANAYPTLPVHNFSEAGRNYQRGYSHGYNILTGETFSSQGTQGGKTPKNINSNTKLGIESYNTQQERASRTEYPKENQNKEISNKEKEDFSQYQAYMEMKRQKEQEEMYYMQQQEKERQMNEKNKELQNQAYSESSQNYNESIPKTEEINEQIKINQNEIPPEYREMYMRQKDEQQRQEIPPEYREMYLRQKDELQRQEIPPEYREMYLRQKDELQRQEIPPEYREMYMRQQIEQQQKEEMPIQEKDIPPEYREIYMRQQVEQKPQEIKRQEEQLPPEYREIYMREQMQKKGSQQQFSNKMDEKEELITQKKQEIPNEYKDIIQQQTSGKDGRTTPYDLKRNNYLNQPNYHDSNMNYHNEMIPQEKNITNNSINNEKIIKQGQISEQEYKEYLLSQQKTREQEKEEENMEMYQNMLREQEFQKEQIQNDKEKEQYIQYLLNQQKQNSNQVKEDNLNQINEKNQYQNYEEKPEIADNNMSNRENMNDNNNKQINSFDDYYKQKGINRPESQQAMLYQKMNENNYDNENKYGNYPQVSKGDQIENSRSQAQGFDEQAYLMYQKQKQLQEMQEMEERERARQILERQQMKNMNLNNMNDIKQQNEYYQLASSNNDQMQIPEKKSEFNTAKMEYLQNKQKNMLSRDNIFSVSEIPKPPPKYNNDPLTKADRLRIQREYAQFLDAQINAKNIKNNKNKNNGLGTLQNSGYDVGGPNPYQQLRDKHNRLKDIPQDPYSTKNYNISNNSYLTSNPITNPVNSYKFVDRRRNSSGRLQNNGSNIIGK